MTLLPDATIRVLIADDHVLFNDGLVLQFSSANSPVEVVGQVFAGDEVLSAVQRLAPDLVLMDINLPRQNGIECARQVKQHFPQVKVVMLTMYAYQKMVEECRQIGVEGYLFKNERAETILNTLRQIQQGAVVFPEKPVHNAHEDDFFVKQFRLTPTEVKVIRLVGQGFSSQEIAEQLFVTVDTVRSHRKNIYRKLEISHLSDLIRFANEHQL